MSSLKKLFNRRRHKRYFVKDGTLVVVSPGNVENPEKVVQLVDISNGGMAFVYQGSPAEIEKSSLLQVVTQKPPYRTESIRFDTVSDEPVAEDAQTSEQFRRRGVKFRWMGFFDETAFKNLIDEIKICEK
ncbi:MAG: PilZ domain-containing protein [Smithella sp.]